jgi:hypothetical protein
MTLNRDTLTIDYINEDGSAFFRQETWSTNGDGS